MTVLRPAEPTEVRARPIGTVVDEVVRVVALLGVAAAAAAFAHVFRDSALAVLDLVTGTENPTEAARSLRTGAVVLAVAGGVVLAAALGHVVARRRTGALGLAAVVAVARGADRPPGLRPTLVRSLGVWFASASMVSVGRESAILETGGALGARVGRWLPRGRADLAAAGIGAAFAAAYHAPLAAVLYGAEHLGLHRRPHRIASMAAGAAVGHVVTLVAFGGHTLFAAPDGGSFDALLLVPLVVLPAAFGARLFLEVRTRTALSARDRLPAPARVAALAVVTAAVVAIAPLTAGNGMEALRHTAVEATLGVALAMAIGKLVATAAALHAGVPGGVFSPTMAVAAGWALVALLGLDALGMPLPGPLWDGVLVAMVVGVAVGVRAPLTAAFVVPEMTGTVGFLPVAAVAAATAFAVDRAVDRARRARGASVPVGLHDEDA